MRAWRRTPPLEAHERSRPGGETEARAVLGELLGGVVGEFAASAWPALEVHRFRLNGIPAFALHALGAVEASFAVGRPLAWAAPGAPVEFDGIAYGEGDHVLLVAPGRYHRWRWPPGALVLGSLLSADGVARLAPWMGLVAAPEAEGVKVAGLRDGPGRVLGSLLHLLATVLPLSDPAASRGRSRPAAGALAVVPRHVKRAEDYLGRHFAEPVTMTALAAEVGVSLRSLHRGFLDFRGVTPARYLQMLRIEAAHRLVTSATCSLDLRQVAAEVGFGSYAPFWRAYVRRFGRAPSNTRRFPAAPAAP